MIIKSILDTDLYKFTTSYAYMKLFPQARGTFEFIDRDNTEYPEDFIERLYLELGSLGMLHLASALYMCSINDDPKDSNRQNVTMRFMAVVDESHIGISTNAIKGQLGGEENEVKAIMWVKMSDLDNYQWAFNHKHLIEGIFHTYVDYEEIEDLDNLFAE
jgi:hypothetical protein